MGRLKFVPKKAAHLNLKNMLIIDMSEKFYHLPFSHMFFIFFIFLSTSPIFALSCNNLIPPACQVCAFSYYDQNLLSSSRISNNIGDSPSDSGCIFRISEYSTRIILIKNTNCTSNDTQFFDACYNDTMVALQAEHDLSLLRTNSSLEVRFMGGSHYLLEESLINLNAELFRMSYVAISMMPLNPSDTVNIIVQTNKFYVFVARSLMIENISFIADFGNNTAFNNFIFHQTTFSNYYALFNLENLFYNMDFNENPLISFQNIVLLNFTPIDIDPGWGGFLSINPYSPGSISIQNSTFDNCYFPKSFLFYSSSRFDLLTTVLQGVSISSAQEIIITECSIKNYNLLQIDNEAIGAFSLFSLTGYSGSFKISNSMLETLFKSNLINWKNYGTQTGKFSLLNTVFLNTSNSTIMSFSYVSNVSISGLTLSVYAAIDLSPFSFINVFSLQLLNFIVFEVTTMKANLINIQQSTTNLTIRDSFFSGLNVENFGVFYSSDVLFFNCSFVKISVSHNLFSSSNTNFFNFSYCYFMELNGVNDFFFTEQISVLNLDTVLIRNATFFTIFYLITTQTNLNSGFYIFQSVVTSIWSADNTCIITTSTDSLIRDNNVFTRIANIFALRTMEFHTSALHIRSNNFYSVTMFTMLVGYGEFNYSIFTDNVFMDPDNFYYVFDFEVFNQMIMNYCHWQDNGVTQKKEYYLSKTDNSGFVFFTITSTIFRNTNFITGKYNDFVSGFFVGAPHSGYFELSNCTFIIMDQNPNFGYKLMILDHFLEAIFVNNTFINIACNDQDFYHSHGGVLLGASASFSYTDNNYLVYMQGNSFSNCNCLHAAVAIIGISTVNMSNNTFYNTSSPLYAGHLLISNGENVYIDQLFLNDSSADEGSGIFVQDFNQVIINRLMIATAFSRKNGVLFCSNIKSLQINSTLAYNLSSLMNGGFVFLYQTNAIISNSQIFQVAAVLDGGVASLQAGSSLKMLFCLINGSNASSGGAISFDNSQQNYIESTLFMNVETLESGVLYIDVYETCQISNVIISNSRALSIGVIYIKSNDEFPSLNIANLTCEGTWSTSGSCIYYISACELSVSNLTVINTGPFPIFAFWSYQVYVKFSVVLIKNNNITDVLVSLEGLIVDASLWSFENNTADQLISLIGSNMTLENVIFANNIGRFAVFLDSSVLSCIKLLFSQDTNESYQLALIDSIHSTSNFSFLFISFCSTTQPAFFVIENSVLNLEDSLVFNNFKLIMTVLNSDLEILNSSFVNNSASGGNDSLTPNDLLIENTDQYNYYLLINSSYLFVTDFYSISSTGNIAIFLINSSFCSIAKKTLIGVYLLLAQDAIRDQIIASKFANFSNGNLKLSNKRTQNLTSFTSFFSTFSSISGNLGSVLYFIGNFKINVSFSLFSNNSALISGTNVESLSGIAPCLLFKPSSLSISRISVTSCKFYNNLAMKIAPTIFSQMAITSKNNDFINNSDSFNFTSKIFSYPLSIQLANSSISVVNITSGVAFELELVLVDLFKQKLVFDMNSLVSLNKALMNMSLSIENSLTNCQNGSFFFKGTVIKTTSNINFSLQVASDFEGLVNDGNNNLNAISISVPIAFYAKKCMVGEILLPDQSCQFCQEGTYSFADPMKTALELQKCNMCTENCFCYGGVYVTPLAGYYRKSVYSKSAIECLSDGACLGVPHLNLTDGSIDGFNESYSEGFCAEGNSGVLCFYCDLNYGRMEKNDICKKCNSMNSLIYLRLCGIVTLIICYILFLFHLGSNVNKDYSKDSVSTYMKILINHVQLLGFIMNNSIKLSIPLYDNFFMVSSYVSFSNNDVVSNDCLLQRLYYNKTNNVIFKNGVNLILPIIFSALAFGAWTLIMIITSHFHRYSKNILKIPRDMKTTFSKYLCFFVHSIYIFYPLILKSCFGIFSCMKLEEDDSASYLKDSPELQCWQGEHMKFVFSVGLPGLFSWGIFFPVWFFFTMKNKLSSLMSMKSSNTIIPSRLTIDIKGICELEPANLGDLEKSVRSIQDSKKNKLMMKESIVKLQTDEVNQMFLFFGRDFRREFYYWECVIFLRKFLLSFLSAMTNTLELEIVVSLMLIVIFMFLSMTLSLRPYRLPQAIIAESSGLFISQLTVLAVLILNSNSSQVFQQFYTVFCLGINAAFLFILVGVIIWNFRKEKRSKSRMSKYQDKIGVKNQNFIKKTENIIKFKVNYK